MRVYDVTLDLPVLAVDVDSSLEAVIAAVVLVNADVLSPGLGAAGALWVVTVLLTDANVSTLGIAVVSTGSLRLRISAFPSSVLDSDALVSLDLSGRGRCLLVLVG